MFNPYLWDGESPSFWWKILMESPWLTARWPQVPLPNGFLPGGRLRRRLGPADLPGVVSHLSLGWKLQLSILRVDYYWWFIIVIITAIIIIIIIVITLFTLSLLYFVIIPVYHNQFYRSWSLVERNYHELSWLSWLSWISWISWISWLSWI